MKNLLLLLFLVIFMVGCPSVMPPPDACDDVTCASGETCNNGVCVTDDPCDGVSCSDTETCVNGACVENEIVGDASFGEAFFMANSCMNCHGADGSGPPSLLNKEAERIFEKLSGAVSHVGGTFTVTEQDAADLAAWLED